MSYETPEKKIIDEIQQYSSPEPRAEFEERLKQQFLQKVKQVRRTRKIFRTVSWSGAVAASVLVGVLLYQSDALPPFGKQSADQAIMSNNMEIARDESPADTKDKIVTKQTSLWQTADPTITEQYPVFEDSASDIKLYQDPEMKKLYAVKGDQMVTVYESTEGMVVGARMYPFLLEPEKLYVTYQEVIKGSDGMDEKTTLHVVVLNGSGETQELSGIPQPGFNANYKIEWSPSRDRAFMAVENSKEWVVGLLNDTSLQFSKLYGDITNEESMTLDLPEREFHWSVSWLDPNSLLIYNAPGQAFYRMMVDEGIAAEIKTADLGLSDDQYVQDIYVPNGSSTYAFIRVGGIMLDLSYQGNQRIYLLDTNPNNPRFEEVKLTLEEKNQLEGYDQYYLGDIGKQVSLIGTVVKKSTGKYSLYFGGYSVESDANQFASLDLKGQAAFGTSLYSPDRKHVAVRVSEYPENAAGVEHVIVLDLEEGRIMQDFTNEFVSSLKWTDDQTLEINEAQHEITE